MHFEPRQDERFLRWASQRLGSDWSPAACRWLSGLDGEAIVWVVVYSHFSSRNCQLSIATDGTRRWASRASLRAIFSAPFLQWGMRRVSFVVASDNAPSLRMMGKRGRSPLGVVEEGRVRAAFPNDVDGLLFGMLKEECKWI